jgi:hypothetical protein
LSLTSLEDRLESPELFYFVLYMPWLLNILISLKIGYFVC